ncbi:MULTISPECIES: hypothetical protein [unclassified Bartonella]
MKYTCVADLRACFKETSGSQTYDATREWYKVSSVERYHLYV